MVANKLEGEKDDKFKLEKINKFPIIEDLIKKKYNFNFQNI